MDLNIINNAKEKFQLYRYKGIEIQCPDCGYIFVFNEKGECFCKRCDRIYTEDEVRAKCGL